jgi:hypothetical protein
MAKRLLSREEIEIMIMAEVRKLPSSTCVTKVTVNRVTTQGADTNWSITVTSSGQWTPQDCMREAMNITRRLQKEYDVAWPS